MASKQKEGKGERERERERGRRVNTGAPLLVSTHNLAFMKNPKYSIAI